jgi:diaminopimelate epimerase
MNILQELPFYKFESTGNDFILIDGRQKLPVIGVEDIRRLCDRRFGIGGDGFIVLREEVGYAFGMEYHNSDGLPGSFCGNGGRAATAFASLLGISGAEYSFVSSDGPHMAWAEQIVSNRWHVELEIRDTVVRHNDLIDTGSPHHVVYTDDLSTIDVALEGARLRHHLRFGPGGCNVNFIREGIACLEVRTFERGVEAETLSCGTGVAAAAIFHLLSQPDGDYTTRVVASGGELTVGFTKKGNQYTRIRLAGMTRMVFNGIYYL